MLQRQSGSFSKVSCLHCWLPPQENSQLCRKCTQRFAEPTTPTLIGSTQVEWIRYHTSSPNDCRAYRLALKENRIRTHVIPEECLYCSAFLLKNPRYASPHASILSSLQTNSCAHWTRKFTLWFQENREEVFEFSATALEILYENQQTCLKLLTALLNTIGPAKKLWILEELVLRPPSLQHILNVPSRIPPHISPDFWGAMTFEEYWLFWQAMPSAAKRRLKFRCLRYKEELMAITWHPDRFLVWCSDLEERRDCREMWGIHI